MNKTVVGLFRDYEEAGAALNDLHRSGFSSREVSLVSRPGSAAILNPHEPSADGAGAGAALGGAAGLIIGLAALAIPGLGPVVAAGPLAASLAGAGLGAAAGGIIGALSQLGVSEHDAGSLAAAVSEGSSLVAVRCDEHDVAKTQDILDRHGAIRPFELPARLVESNSDPSGTDDYGSGGTATMRSVRTYVANQPANPKIDNEFRRHFETTFYMRGAYEEFSEAYHYGLNLSFDQRYAESDWTSIEPVARTGWEQSHPGTWNRMKDAVRHSWDYVRGHRTRS